MANVYYDDDVLCGWPHIWVRGRHVWERGLLLLISLSNEDANYFNANYGARGRIVWLLGWFTCCVVRRNLRWVGLRRRSWLGAGTGADVSDLFCCVGNQ